MPIFDFSNDMIDKVNISFGKESGVMKLACRKDVGNYKPPKQTRKNIKCPHHVVYKLSEALNLTKLYNEITNWWSYYSCDSFTCNFSNCIVQCNNDFNRYFPETSN